MSGTYVNTAKELQRLRNEEVGQTRRAEKTKAPNLLGARFRSEEVLGYSSGAIWVFRSPVPAGMSLPMMTFSLRPRI